eukprot:TRINITY_DN15266_c0_g1_i1.p1 TRINITY_DN15266_c0_g1~~TRINITY_DN15266_c0_g1_i1.p1  ORF type:complete len:113 (-),score=8.54 TRINITY_DN15266_c0_g1_i1:137-475(-)
MGFLNPGWATFSFFLMIASIISAILICLWLRFCFYPGGRRREDVIDASELPKYNPENQVDEEAAYDESEAYTTQSEDRYYEAPNQRPGKPSLKADRVAEEPKARRSVQMMEI